MTKQADLSAYLFDGKPHLEGSDSQLAGELLRWMEASPRFIAFVETYRDKIRKKVRLARSPQTALDLRGELVVAYRLLNDRRLAVAYEPYASARGRGPDFAVTYRDNLVLNIEVARIRGEDRGSADGITHNASDLARQEERILRVLLDKLGQMQPGMPNLLVIQTQEELARSIDLDRLMQAVKTRVERTDPSFYAISRYASPAVFYKDFNHLSGILLWAVGVQTWVNKQARPALAENILRLVSALLSPSHQP